jgi:nucleotide-binding universal stress UspA family protein
VDVLAAYLERVATRLLASGLAREAISATVRIGGAARTLLECATADEGTLLALATHARRGLARILQGSVAEALVATAPVPVLVVRRPGGALSGPPPEGRPRAA